MNYETISFSHIEKGIGHLRLRRTHCYNAINHQMMEEIEDFWRERLYDLDTVVIILSSDCEKGFCAGLDMKETAEMAPKMNVAEFYRFQARLARLNLAMRRAPQPIICAVHGAAAGQGFSFVLASDIRLITPDSRFSAAYINIGLGGADMSCSYFLPRMIGAGRAYEFMYTGEFMSAEEALSLGLVSKIVDRERLLESALEYARLMMTKNHMGLRLTKEAININLDAGGLEAALNMEDRNQTLLAIGAFLNK
ncbi:MAG: 1,2-epoxyphenylacetyl-CoA isomerase [Spirochaetes bacterium ADurb.BinA120]|nr:MAG: 1,2-epoxyphenylacetyl-CoA isomerase [Spirochaetes bacterium ADurb.BinA120]